MQKWNCVLILLLIHSALVAQYQAEYLTDDGAWCWFSDPRAIKVEDYIITGWVKANGTVEALKLDLKSGKFQEDDLYYRLEKDDHNNPAFTLTEGGKILAMYTRHSVKDLFINQLDHYRSDSTYSRPEFIHPISDSELLEFPRETVTYANPYRLKAENNRIYCFGRWTGFKPNIMWSDDNGKSWSDSKVFITNHPFDPNNRPYVKYSSDGNSRIHFVFTDGHPRVEPTNSVYYAYYEKGHFYKADGNLITRLDKSPFEPKDASVVYTSNEKDGRAWIADIGQDQNDQPVLLYTRSPTEENHEYWYARYHNGNWQSYKICDSGKWFPQTPEGEVERELHYFGGMTLHPSKENVIYLSRQIDGVFEIERWETGDGGKTWTSEPITKDSSLDNVRPYIPRGLEADEDEIVLWMENEKYIHYTDYDTGIKYSVIKGKK